MEASTPPPTIRLDQIIEAHCEHCAATTVQMVGGSGLGPIDGESCDPTKALNRACLQCIADGGGCCSLRPMDRRA